MRNLPPLSAFPPALVQPARENEHFTHQNLSNSCFLSMSHHHFTGGARLQPIIRPGPNRAGGAGLLHHPASRNRTARVDEDWIRKDRSMPTGTVKWFNTTKGFGFIAPDDGGKDVFVHISAVERAGMTGLPDNMKISFELREGRDGRSSAVELQKID
jgi:cold shock protein